MFGCDGVGRTAKPRARGQCYWQRRELGLCAGNGKIGMVGAPVATECLGVGRHGEAARAPVCSSPVCLSPVPRLPRKRSRVCCRPAARDLAASAWRSASWRACWIYAAVAISPAVCLVDLGCSFLCAGIYCLRYRPAARRPQIIDTGIGHIGFRCVKPVLRWIIA